MTILNFPGMHPEQVSPSLPVNPLLHLHVCLVPRSPHESENGWHFEQLALPCGAKVDLGHDRQKSAYVALTTPEYFPFEHGRHRDAPIPTL